MLGIIGKTIGLAFKTAVGGGAVYGGVMYRDKLGEAWDSTKGFVSEIFENHDTENGNTNNEGNNPTTNKLPTTISEGKTAAKNLLDNIVRKKDEVVAGADENRAAIDKGVRIAKDPLSVFSEKASGGEDDFDFMKMLKWVGGIGTGGFIASQATGGAVGIGLTLLIGAAAFTYMNKDMVMGLKDDLVSKVTDNENNVASNKGFDNSDLVVSGMDLN